ncbi:MAG: hypothetical protein ACRDP3_09935 [Streptomyces sp.]|uniref:hypothetical protein n=1 Tax=Streptomyces sp. TaxID=1931 RepID=UPI003D6B5678
MAQRLVNLRRSGRSGQASDAWLAIPIALLVGILMLEAFGPGHVHLGPLLVAAPMITAYFAGAWLTGLMTVLAVATQAGITVLSHHDDLISADHMAQIIALTLAGFFLVIFCVLRERRRRELQQVRYVSETAQRLVMRPLPEKIGPLRVASMYLAAEAEALVGGDLYAVARTGTSTRLIIGDVRGKGMPPFGDVPCCSAPSGRPHTAACPWRTLRPISTAVSPGT